MKKSETRFQRISNNKGITLLALVITIIIIIILSAITLNSVLGDRGILERTRETKETTEEMVNSENDEMEGLLQEHTNVIEEDIQNSTMPEGWDASKVKVAISADGVKVPVPKGFTASSVTEEDGRKAENTVAGGFVIYQGDGAVTNANVEEEQKTRNQFVWIPVNEEDLAEMYNTSTPETAEDTALAKSSFNEETTTTKLYSNLRVRNGDLDDFTAGTPNSTNVREPDILIDTTAGDADTDADKGINLLKSELGYSGTEAEILKNFAQDMVDEYEAVFNSIKKYGGFYIGRYELTGTADNPTVQREKDVLTADPTEAKNWYGLKDACNKMVSNDKVESIMIYGNQWDEVMDWLVDTGAKSDSEVNENSSSWGNYRDSSEEADIEGAGNLQQSGYSDAWSANNIYDLAGNYRDFTQEANSTYSRVIRRRHLLQFRL